MEDLEDALEELAVERGPRGVSQQDIEHILGKFTQSMDLKASSLFQHRKEIDAIFSANSVENIVKGLQDKHAISSWAASNLDVLSKASPTALKMGFEACRQGKVLPLSKVYAMEYRLTQVSKDAFPSYPLITRQCT